MNPPPEPWAVGLDIGGTNIKVVGAPAGLLSSGSTDGSDNGGKWRSVSRPTSPSDPPAVVLSRAAEAVGKVTGGAPSAAVGVALPGNVDVDAGTALYVPALGVDWEGYEVGAELGSSVGATVVLLNDVHAMTLAEATLGAARGASEALCVAVGTGVGGGLMLGGRLHRGPSGTAGAIGHTTVEPDGPACVCGNLGCVEVFASGPAIARQAGQPTPAAAAAAASAGDATAVAAYTRAGMYLGVAVANVVTMVTPSQVVVGGGVAAAGDLLLDPLRAELERRVRVASLDGTTVVPAALGYEAGALGAALAAVDSFVPDDGIERAGRP